jgi:hypothetical protein
MEAEAAKPVQSQDVLGFGWAAPKSHDADFTSCTTFCIPTSTSTSTPTDPERLQFQPT